ncbi:MAG: hypothetical protein IJB49_00665 [Clostridia bacterium]|nr:hypothetical protein [Clostridia bacterium]
MEVYCEPNLPKRKVRRAFISALLPLEIEEELNDFGIITYRLGHTNNIGSELAYHPDILVNNFRKGMWICESNAGYIPEEFPRSLFRESETELSHLYPYDCPFNNFRVGHALVCGRSADYLIKAFAKYEGLRQIQVIQNYTKCCCIPINNRAVITSDYYIAKALEDSNFDVLYVEDSEKIGLRGFSHGLIGGCAGMLSENILGFTGDLNKYEFGEDIRNFCANYRVDAFSLTNKPMYDYGGILPITEIALEVSDDTAECIFNNGDF